MKTRFFGAALCVLIATTVHPLTPPSASDGPVKLLSCVVTANGMLEAAVDNTSEDRQRCHIRCSYQMAERTFNHSFVETIPARFQGRVGRFDTTTGKAGSYPGEISGCEKTGR